MQVDPIKSTLKAPGIQRLKLKCDESLSNFVFDVNLCRYITDEQRQAMATLDEKQKLESEIDGHQRRANDAKDRADNSARDFARRETELNEQASQLKMAEEMARKDKDGAVAAVDGLKAEIAAGKRANEVGQCRLTVSNPS